jgi:hypothetical protein
MTQIPQTRMSSWISRAGDVVRMPVISTRHGGNGWSNPFAGQVMTQPQDGAVDTRTRLANIRSHQHSDVLHEAEDARLTGGTRSLDRRLLGLNVLEMYRKRSAATVGEIGLARIEVA